MSDYAQHFALVAASAAWGWYMRDGFTKRANLRDRRVEFYDDLKSMAARIDTMGKFGVGVTAVAHYRRSDGTRFKLSVEKVEP